ncbi:MAG: hypothetical protein DRP89_08840 [Candidatus Neomarinimicrobiota bacterium]|nr:MAG: hypothetical protein DRP89_08840 [Candidatus Neomarinimicrobiota bacterium]
MLDTYSLAAMKYTKYPDLVKSLLKYLTRRENWERFYTAGGGGFQTPVAPKFEELLSVWDNPKFRPFLDTLPTGRVSGWPGPPTRAAEVEAVGVITDMWAKAATGAMSIEEAVTEATKRMEKIYAGYYPEHYR